MISKQQKAELIREKLKEVLELTRELEQEGYTVSYKQVSRYVPGGKAEQVITVSIFKKIHL